MSNALDERVDEIVERWEENIDFILERDNIVINDPVHGSVHLGGFEATILDLPPVQKLREIRQLGSAAILYPAANHTRFEHTVGTYKNTCEMLERVESSLENNDDVDVEINEVQREEVKAAAILHDIGHLPFSHPTEPLVGEEISRIIQEDGDFPNDDVHEYIAWKYLSHDYMKGLIECEIAPAYGNSEISVERIKGLISGLYRDPSGDFGVKDFQFLADIVSGPVDADRLDYLQRESHKVGFPSIVDTDRIYDNLEVMEGPNGTGEYRLGINAKAVEAAKSLFIARDRLGQIVHDHHVTTVSEDIMLRDIDGTYEDKTNLIGQTDYELFRCLIRDGKLSEYRMRRLPKRFMYFAPSNKYTDEKPMGEIRDDIKDAFGTLRDRINMEDELVGDVGLTKRVIVSYFLGPDSVGPNIGRDDARKFHVKDNRRGEVDTLKVYVDREYRNEITLLKPQIRVFCSWENLQKNPPPKVEAVKEKIANKMEVDPAYLEEFYKPEKYTNILS